MSSEPVEEKKLAYEAADSNGAVECTSSAQTVLKQDVTAEGVEVNGFEPKSKTSAGDSPVSNEQGEKVVGQQRKKKEKQPKLPTAPAAPSRALSDPTRWKMVVGLVTRVWEHEASEKLWCEEIDIGAGEIRQIGSGLRQFVLKEDFEGTKVIVLTNLKEKKLGGFPSHGMVICASSASHDQVELLVPPANAEVGDIVTFEGLEGEPDATLTAKKNGDTIASVMDTLRTDNDLNAVAGQHKFLVRGQPVKSKTLANAHVG